MPEGHLRTNSLSTLETAAFSVAIMGPSASISIVVLMMAQVVTYSAPLVLAISLLAVALVTVSIVKLNCHFPSSGSVYRFAEKTFGRQAGFMAGWLIAFAYLALGVSCTAIVAAYTQILLGYLGMALPWLPLAFAVLVLIFLLARMNARLNMRLLLIFEALTMGLLLILSCTILAKSSATHVLSLKPFGLGGNSLSAVAMACVFGFLAFSGFEGASALGEESRNPKRAIPLAVATAVLVSGLFYIFVGYAQVIGFGISPEGIQALTSTDTPMSELAMRFMNPLFASLILVCVTLSFFSTALGCVSAGARVLYTMGHDRMLDARLSHIHPRYDSPTAAIKLLIAVFALVLAACFHLDVMMVARYAATIGTLALILTYLVATGCAMRYFYDRGEWKGLKLLLPLAACGLLAYILFANVYPVPGYPDRLFPYILLLWLLIGAVIGRRMKSRSADEDLGA